MKKTKDISVNTESYQTENYDQFKHGSNRKVKDSHVKSLMESMLKYGYIKEMRILVTVAKFILDGQHRLESAKRLGITLIYEISNLPNGIIPYLNRTQMKWSPLDYLDFYISEGKKEYIKLSKLMKTSGLSLTSCRNLATINFNHGGGQYTAKYRAGTFRFRNEKRTYEILSYLKDFAPYIPHYGHKEFIRGFITFLLEQNSYDHKAMLKKISTNKHRFIRSSELHFYFNTLKEVYKSKV